MTKEKKLEKQKRGVELLAPAGTKEAFIAAVENGAGAVYLAGTQFGARAGADNFDEENLRWAVRFAHLRGVRVHVTVNTIVRDEELEGLAAYLRFLDRIDVDAILVQDLGVARLARRVAPKLPLHASTQMSVHNLAGVQALKELGFSRVVLAREVPLADIRAICAASDIEIEVFMHGALCVCYSGQCLMSSMIGGRSGNRGRCAQPCRLPYTMVDENGENALEGRAGKYLLSPRDLNTIDLIPALLEAGVASLKIEGRMKRPEYVATVVRTYRQAIDRCERGEAYMVSDAQRDALTQVFNRDFTTAYLEKNQGKNMMSDRRPNNRGLLVGRVVSYDRETGKVCLHLSRPLAVGDQVDFWVKVGGRVAATIGAMQDGDGNTLQRGEAGQDVFFSVPSRVHPHDRAFKVYDAALMERAKETFASGAPVRRIPLRVRAVAAVGAPLRLYAEDADGNRAEAQTAFIGETAKKRPLTAETLQKQIARLGTSVFALEQLDCDIRGEVMVPMSEINEARRALVEALEEKRLAPFHRREAVPTANWQDEGTRRRPPQPARLMAAVETLEQAEAAVRGGADGLLYGGESYRHHFFTKEDYQRVWQFARAHHVRIDFDTPRVVRMAWQPHFEQMLAAWQACPPDAVHVHSLSTLAIVRRKTDFALHADYSLISFNHLTLDFLKDYGVAEATLSPELNVKQIAELAPRAALPLSAIAYGRLELMISAYCAAGAFLGNVDKGKCTQPCLGRHFSLEDRKGARFPLAMDQYCHMHVLNSKTLTMLAHVMAFREWGVKTLRLLLKDRTPEEVERVTRDFVRAMKLREPVSEQEQAWLERAEGQDFTRGHYYRGVL